MSRFRSFQLGLVLLGALAALASGQDAQLAPKPPFISPVPDNMILTIKVSSEPAGLDLPPGCKVVTQIVSIKSGGTREVISEWSDGSKSEVWFYRGYRLEQAPGNGPIMVTPLTEWRDPENDDFFGLHWLKLANYAGMESQDGEACYHFKSQVVLKEERMKLDNSAFIDVKTGRPVAWNSGPTHFELVSLEARNPAEPLVLPEAFAHQLQAYLQASGVPKTYLKQ